MGARDRSDRSVSGPGLSAGHQVLMKPVPFPEPYRSMLEEAGGQFRQWGAPHGHDDEVAPVEACSYRTGVVALDEEVYRDDQYVTSVVIELSDSDLELLQQTRMFEFGVWGHSLPVFFFNPLRSPSEDELAEFHNSREGSRGSSVDSGEVLDGTSTPGGSGSTSESRTSSVDSSRGCRLERCDCSDIRIH